MQGQHGPDDSMPAFFFFFFFFCAAWSANAINGPLVSLSLLLPLISPFPSRYLSNSVPARWTEAASPALRSFLMRFWGSCGLIPWCIARSFLSTADLCCCRQSRAGGSWPRSPWTESRHRTDTTMFSTLARVHTQRRMNDSFAQCYYFENESQEWDAL